MGQRPRSDNTFINLCATYFPLPVLCISDHPSAWRVWTRWTLGRLVLEQHFNFVGTFIAKSVVLLTGNCYFGCPKLVLEQHSHVFVTWSHRSCPTLPHVCCCERSSQRTSNSRKHNSSLKSLWKCDFKNLFGTTPAQLGPQLLWTALVIAVELPKNKFYNQKRFLNLWYGLVSSQYLRGSTIWIRLH